MPTFVIVIAPISIGIFLATGLHARRRRVVPLWWWLLLILVCGLPSLVVALGFVFAADRPVIHFQQQTLLDQLISGVVFLTPLLLPFLLVRATGRLSRGNDRQWQAGLVMTPIVLVPINFMALLAAAQMLSGVSL